jgi:DNA-binding transcriptional regulator YhcF (GntR family)
MKIWLSKNSEVSVREQLIAQITLGITSSDLKPGEKLPSTRELARRFQIHPNTVSAAYRELTSQGLVEMRQGSGVYVREHTPENKKSLLELDGLIANLKREAQTHGFTTEEIQARLKDWFEMEKPQRYLVVESEDGLRRILIEEIRQSTGSQTSGISFENFSELETDAQIVAMTDEMARINEILPPHKTCLFLRANSVPESMQGETRPSSDALIAVISHWERFLNLAKMFLVAARIDPETLILRSTNEENWKRGLQNVSLIICDSVTAKEFPNDARVRVFRVISQESLAELKG